MSTETLTLSPHAYRKASGIFKVLTLDVVQHIIAHLTSRRDVEAKEMVSSQYSYATILKYIRKLEHYQLIRRERLGREVTYRLNDERLKTINLSASRCL